MPENQTEVSTEGWSQESVEKQAQTSVETPPPVPEQQDDSQEKERVEVEKVVPLKALQAERATLREMKQNARAMQEQMAQLQRMNIELMQRTQAPPAPPPDESTDPVGALQHNVKQTNQRLDYMAQQTVAQQRAAYEAQQRQAFAQHVATLETEFAQRQPDAIDAIKHWQQAVLNEYTSGGMTPDAARQRIQQESMQIAWEAVQRGENPAEVVYNRAQARGYTPAKRKLDMQREGQGASMPTGAGGKSGGNPSLESLLKMSTDEFLKATSGNKWQQLLNR